MLVYLTHISPVVACLQSCQLNAYFVDAELEADSHLAKAMGGGNSSTAPNGTFISALA